jgi:hypothetical protein
MHLNEGYLGTIVHFVAKVNHSTMHAHSHCDLKRNPKTKASKVTSLI